jgi:outer membrane receptor protein involved in Fe transport
VSSSGQQAGTGKSDDQEIVVTARRREENLQDVPGTVNVVAGKAVQDYNITKFTDVQTLVPGLTLSDNAGFDQVASMRGIAYNQIQAAPETVAFYLNDVPERAQHVFQGLYDIGQIEVLRGPQGTVRGRTSPSGSITVTTRRPDLHEIGGYVEGSVGTLDNYNLQGAVSVPIIPGKLAIRVAGLRDENSVNGIRSVFNPTKPKQVTNSARVSVLFQPTDNLSVNIVYQHLYRRDSSYNTAVFGSGSPGVPGNPFAPAGFNGPVIGIRDRLTNAAGPQDAKLKGDQVQAHVDWDLLGQRLSYIFGYGDFSSYYISCNDERTTGAPFPCFPQIGISTEKDHTHEVRLTSRDRVFGFLDYTVGFFHNDGVVPTTVYLPPSFLAGAFGSPLLPPMPGIPNSKFAVAGVLTTNPNKIKENAFYGSLTAHVGERTEITVGLRQSTYFHTINTIISFAPAAIALALPGPICGLIGGAFQATYTNVCDLPVNVNPFHVVHQDTPEPFIYNVELSHRFSDELMVYAKTGSAFRASNISLGLAVSTTNPALNPYLIPDNEKSKSYEIGAKLNLFHNRLQLDVDYYHQKFDGYFYQTLPAYFLDTGPPLQVKSGSFTVNVPAIVDGVELTATARPLTNWTIGTSFSWANGRLNNALIPCNSSNFNGVIDNIQPTVAQFQAAGVAVATCESNAATTTAPKWSLTAQTEYEHHLSNSLVGFGRALVYYYPSNPNSSATYVVPAYGLVNLYLGVRDAHHRWEVTAYAKNIFKNETVTSKGTTDTWGNGLAAFFGEHTGYFSATLPARREFGVTGHFQLGGG